MLNKQDAKNKNSHRVPKVLPKLSLFFFRRPLLSLGIWLVLVVFGIASYTTLLKREGFPSVNIPFTVVSGTYLVNNPSKVDQEIAKPLSDAILKADHVKRVQTQSYDNFTNLIVQYEAGTDGSHATQNLENQVRGKVHLPATAVVKFDSPKFGFTDRGDDMVISFYSKNTTKSTAEITAKAKEAEAFLKNQNLSLVDSLSLIDPYAAGIDPTTGKQAHTQQYFDRYGERQGSKNKFYPSASIGLTNKKGADVIEIDKQVRDAVNKLNSKEQFKGYTAAVSASYAPDIKQQVNELQRSLLEGLIAAIVVGAIVIALRASIITSVAMLTVISTTLGLLYIFGYSLNTITLFALVLGLALIVDDTIIMIEAIDAQRRRTKIPEEAVAKATTKISRAMLAATSTAVLSFAPLLFVGGILGDFIRAIPITVIASLLISLLVAIIFIPTFARVLLLRKKQMGEGNVREVAAGVEAKIARFIGRPLLWAKNSRRKLWLAGISALVIGLGFILAGGWLFSKVTFNIFPPSKDSNGLMISMTFPNGTTIEQAEKIADKVDGVVGSTVNSEFKVAAYYSSGTSQQARLRVILTPYTARDIRAPEIAASVQKALNGQVKDVQAKVGQEDVGPPAAAFNVQIQSNDRTKAYKLANDLSDYLKHAELKRVSGEKIKITSTTIANPNIYTRDDSKQYVAVTAEFDGTDTSTLVTITQDAIKKEFNAKKLASYGLSKNTLKFDIGQEEENQESFKTLAIAFPILLVAIFILLFVEFRSLLQPLLIFMAIPFSLFGITLGLYLTHNAFSFFAMLGFFALLGLSIKNTILLTDYANQSRAAGMRPVDAVHEALQERFRPLIATSFTAVIALIPLALTSPFWEGLMVVLIFGLLSSTFLVITVFPYYYLGAEFLRMRISRKGFFGWVLINAVVVGASLALKPIIAIFALLALNFVFIALKLYQRKYKYPWQSSK
jgi:multidrug efflux pump subunit AcrB